MHELCSTKWIVIAAAATALAYYHDLETALCLVGAVLNGILSKILKKMLRMPRPTGAPLADPGMPSSHAQSLFFFAVYIAFSIGQMTASNKFKVVAWSALFLAVRVARGTIGFVSCTAL